MRFLISISCDGSAIADHFRSLASELIRRGHSVTMATWGKRVEQHWAPEGVQLVRYPSARPVRWADVRFSYRLMRERKIDCCVANFGAANVNAVAGWLAGVPVRVLWCHTLLSQLLADRRGVGEGSVLQFLRKRFVYGLATHVVANSGAMREELRRVWKVPNRKLAMFWYGIPDPLGGEGKAIARQRGRILCPGRLHPSKGQDVLIRALPQVLAAVPEAEVLLAGDGPERARLEKLAMDGGVAGKVRFAGALERRRLFEEMAGAAVSVVPSRSEAFGLVNVESMAVGTPVVASRVGGIPEIVRDGVDGLLFEPGNPEQVGECLVRLLREDRLREEMGRNARERFLNEFESGRMVKRQADWVEGLMLGRVVRG